MDKKEFLLRLYKLGDLFARQVSAFQGETYYEALKGYSRDQLIRAFNHVATTERFFPPIVAFKEYLGNSVGALDLFRKIEETLRSGYGRNSYKEAREYMGEQAYKAIEMMGGWANYCNMEPMKANQELMRCCAKVANDSPEASQKEIEG